VNAIRRERWDIDPSSRMRHIPGLERSRGGLRLRCRFVSDGAAHVKSQLPAAELRYSDQIAAGQGGPAI